MIINDALKPPAGHFRLNVYRRGLLVDVMDKGNLIVVGSQLAHAKLLGGAVTNQSVGTIGFGTSGTTPAFGNTGLTGVYTKALDSATYPASNQVQFNFSLASGDDNGMAIMEFGLLNGLGALYARIVRSSALNKASDISLSGSWTITF